MNEKIGEIRPSQLITTFGPGAIMDLPDLSVIIAGVDQWDQSQCDRIKEPRIMKKLGIKKILAPPVSKFESDKYLGTLPAYRFPTYQVCPKCRRLSSVYSGEFYLDENETALCRCEGKVRVFPSRFIVACPKGHIDDFPWHYYVHEPKKRFKCKSNLRLNDLGASGAISDVEVECMSCGDKRTLQDAFSKKFVYRCTGHRHWNGPDDMEPCDESIRSMLRGASNLYFPVVESSLAIPPYTGKTHLAVTEVTERIDELTSKDDLAFAVKLGLLKEFRGMDLEEVWDTIQNQRSIPNGQNLDLLYPEWLALTAGDTSSGEYDFEIEEETVPEGFQKWISKVVMVRRLSEIRVLDGFSRIEPLPDASILLSENDETARDSHKISLGSGRLDWRPGILTKGEGILITLDEKKVAAWEGRVANEFDSIPMYDAFLKYCEDRNIQAEFPGIRYILLHSLSHALMRQLCMSSGYSSSALRERIYSRNIQGQEMAGILIYTATPDSEGSLGGLVELAKRDSFEQVLWEALQEATFCSADPLCSEHNPDAMGDLNGAACHACQLAAETSCEKSNRFLDRSFLVPTVSEKRLSFFE